MRATYTPPAVDMTKPPVRIVLDGLMGATATCTAYVPQPDGTEKEVVIQQVNNGFALSEVVSILAKAGSHR